MSQSYSEPVSAKNRLNIAEQVCGRWANGTHQEELALLYKDKKITYSDLWSQVSAFAAALLEKGLHKGDRFILHGSNHPGYVIGTLAGMAIGAVPVPTSILFRRKELTHVAKNCNIRAVVTCSKHVNIWKSISLESQSIDQELIFNWIHQDWRNRKLDGFKAFNTTSQDPAFILHSSGSTGIPKSIVHAHRWITGGGYPVGKSLLGLTTSDIVLCPHEICHIQAFGAGLLVPLYFGSTVVIDDEKTTALHVLNVIQRDGVTVLKTVTALARLLTQVTEQPKLKLPTLKRCVSGTESLRESDYREWNKRFDAELLEGFGQTELSIFCGNSPGSKIKPGSFGRALPGHDVQIVDEQGFEVPTGKTGFLAVKDDDQALFLEYVNMPELREQVFRHGWYYTGDLAHIDNEGHFWFEGRTDDLFKSSGYSISPREVEEVLEMQPSVQKTCVLGIPDQTRGNIVKAFVELRPGYKPSLELANELRQRVREVIAPYKGPREIEFIARIPRNTTGKVLKTELRQKRTLDETVRFFW